MKVSEEVTFKVNLIECREICFVLNRRENMSRGN